MEPIRDLVIRAAGEPCDRESLVAYSQLVDRFRDMACGYAYSMLGDFHLAEDAAQDAFVTAYRKLGQLSEPDAFPGWFRRIVWSACGRISRRRPPPPLPIEAAQGALCTVPEPSLVAQDQEIRARVRHAVSQLPASEREVTTLFYISGHSQREIAEFLEVPVGTVKNRLVAARARLKGRMMNMVENTLRENAPDERFSQKVIAGLLSGPDLLKLEAHPISRTWLAMRLALPEYEFIEGQETVDQSAIVNAWALQFAYRPSGDTVLRTETVCTLFNAMANRRPPVRLITSGRRFGVTAGDPDAHRVHHSFTVLRVDAAAGREAMETAIRRLVEAAIGPVKLRYADAQLKCMDYCKQVFVDQAGQWTGISLGCGVFTAQTLANAGFDASQVSGFAFCGDIEGMATLKHGIADASELWRPPYVP